MSLLLSLKNHNYGKPIPSIVRTKARGERPGVRRRGSRPTGNRPSGHRRGVCVRHRARARCRGGAVSCPEAVGAGARTEAARAGARTRTRTCRGAGAGQASGAEVTDATGLVGRGAQGPSAAAERTTGRLCRPLARLDAEGGCDQGLVALNPTASISRQIGRARTRKVSARCSSCCGFMGVQKSANALLICTFCTPMIGGMKRHATPTWSLADLSPLELRRKITTKEAAELNGVSEDMFKRHYRHLIRRIGPPPSCWS